MEGKAIHKATAKGRKDEDQDAADDEKFLHGVLARAKKSTD